MLPVLQELGLLSRAFKSTRTLSLSNLLDLGIEDIDKRVVEVGFLVVGAILPLPCGLGLGSCVIEEGWRKPGPHASIKKPGVCSGCVLGWRPWASSSGVGGASFSEGTYCRLIVQTPLHRASPGHTACCLRRAPADQEGSPVLCRVGGSCQSLRGSAMSHVEAWNLGSWSLAIVQARSTDTCEPGWGGSPVLCRAGG